MDYKALEELIGVQMDVGRSDHLPLLKRPRIPLRLSLRTISAKHFFLKVE